MDIGIISRRYAKALLQYACDEKHEDIVFEQCRTLFRQMKTLPELRQAIESPMVAHDEKLKLMQNATAGEDTCEELNRFFRLLLEKRREKFMAFIIHSFLHLYRKKKKIRKGVLITAVPLPESTQEELKQLILQRYRGRTVEFENRIDPSIIGGVILGIGYWRIDASVKGRLARIKKEFIEKNKRIV